MGSVKDLTVIEPASAKGMGDGSFEFSNRYSVFDWGEMPDHLENKGAALCVMSAYFFEKVEEEGIHTHYLGLEQDGLIACVDSLDCPVTKMDILLARVIKPEVVYGSGKAIGYDYENVRKANGNYVIPIEVIYRNSLPKGSSVFRRLKEGTLTLQEMGLTEQPAEGQRLAVPFVDGSTKYEEFDRYPGWSELQHIAGLSDKEVHQLKAIVLQLNETVSDGMAAVGLGNEDGKFEFAFDSTRNLMLVDTLATLDECRFTYKGVDVSKEIPRQYYRFSQPAWVAEIDAAKEATKKGWKDLVKSRPEPLPSELKEILEALYPAVANVVIGRPLFFGIPPVAEVVQEYEKFKRFNMK